MWVWKETLIGISSKKQNKTFLFCNDNIVCFVVVGFQTLGVKKKKKGIVLEPVKEPRYRNQHGSKRSGTEPRPNSDSV